MAESMKGLKRSHRCTEVSNKNIGEEIRKSVKISETTNDN